MESLPVMEVASPQRRRGLLPVPLMTDGMETFPSQREEPLMAVMGDDFQSVDQLQSEEANEVTKEGGGEGMSWLGSAFWNSLQPMLCGCYTVESDSERSAPSSPWKHLSELRNNVPKITTPSWLKPITIWWEKKKQQREAIDPMRKKWIRRVGVKSRVAQRADWKKKRAAAAADAADAAAEISSKSKSLQKGNSVIPNTFENQAAAIAIQRVIRGFLGRLQAAAARKECLAEANTYWLPLYVLYETTQQKKRIRAAVTKEMARDFVDQLVHAGAELASLASHASSVVQRVWRGHAARQRVRNMRIPHPPPQIPRKKRLVAHKQVPKLPPRLSLDVLRRVWARKWYEPPGFPFLHNTEQSPQAVFSTSTYGKNMRRGRRIVPQKLIRMATSDGRKVIVSSPSRPLHPSLNTSATSTMALTGMNSSLPPDLENGTECIPPLLSDDIASKPLFRFQNAPPAGPKHGNRITHIRLPRDARTEMGAFHLREDPRAWVGLPVAIETREEAIIKSIEAKMTPSVQRLLSTSPYAAKLFTRTLSTRKMKTSPTKESMVSMESAHSEDFVSTRLKRLGYSFADEQKTRLPGMPVIGTKDYDAQTGHRLIYIGGGIWEDMATGEQLQRKDQYDKAALNYQSIVSLAVDAGFEHTEAPLIRKLQGGSLEIVPQKRVSVNNDAVRGDVPLEGPLSEMVYSVLDNVEKARYHERSTANIVNSDNGVPPQNLDLESSVFSDFGNQSIMRQSTDSGFSTVRRPRCRLGILESRLAALREETSVLDAKDSVHVNAAAPEERLASVKRFNRAQLLASSSRREAAEELQSTWQTGVRSGVTKADEQLLLNIANKLDSPSANQDDTKAFDAIRSRLKGDSIFMVPTSMTDDPTVTATSAAAVDAKSLVRSIFQNDKSKKLRLGGPPRRAKSHFVMRYTWVPQPLVHNAVSADYYASRYADFKAHNSPQVESPSNEPLEEESMANILLSTAPTASELPALSVADELSWDGSLLEDEEEEEEELPLQSSSLLFSEDEEPAEASEIVEDRLVTREVLVYENGNVRRQNILVRENDSTTNYSQPRSPQQLTMSTATSNTTKKTSKRRPRSNRLGNSTSSMGSPLHTSGSIVVPQQDDSILVDAYARVTSSTDLDAMSSTALSNTPIDAVYSALQTVALTRAERRAPASTVPNQPMPHESFADMLEKHGQPIPQPGSTTYSRKKQRTKQESGHWAHARSSSPGESPTTKSLTTQSRNRKQRIAVVPIDKDDLETPDERTMQQRNPAWNFSDFLATTRPGELSQVPRVAQSGFDSSVRDGKVVWRKVRFRPFVPRPTPPINPVHPYEWR